MDDLKRFDVYPTERESADHTRTPDYRPEAETFWRVEGINYATGGRCAFPGIRMMAAVGWAELDRLKKEHPEYDTWKLLRFEPWVHIYEETR